MNRCRPLLSVLFLLASPVWAFTLNGSSNLVGWGTDMLYFSVNYSGCEGERNRLDNAIDNAVALWGSVPTSSIRLGRAGESQTSAWQASTKNSLDAPNIICDDDLTTSIGGIDSTNIAGVGIGIAKESGLQIDYGYLLLNGEDSKTAYVGNLSDTVVAVVVAHEMGHVLGLGHTDEASCLMYFKASDKTEANLCQDDMDAITYLYPRGELLGGSSPFGCASVAIMGAGGSDRKGPPGPPSAGAVLFLGWLMVFAWIARIMRKTKVVPCPSLS